MIECWNCIPEHYPQIRLHEFTLMPNHIHGILEITEPEDSPGDETSKKTTTIVEGFGWAQNVEPLPNNFLKRSFFYLIIFLNLGRFGVTSPRRFFFASS